MYLVDTNVWLERLLGQDKSDEVGKFLDLVSSDQSFITDFAFHSICVILTRLKRNSVLLDFINDAFVSGSVTLVSIKPDDTQNLIDAIDKHRFDFDDAYQYVVAEQHELIIVSFDGDFDRTAQGRKTPAEILATS